MHDGRLRNTFTGTLVALLEFDIILASQAAAACESPMLKGSPLVALNTLGSQLDMLAARAIAKLELLPAPREEHAVVAEHIVSIPHVSFPHLPIAQFSTVGSLGSASSMNEKGKRGPRAAKADIPERLDESNSVIWFFMHAHWSQKCKTLAMLLGLLVLAFGAGFGAARVEPFASLIPAISRLVKAPYEAERTGDKGEVGARVEPHK